MPKLTRTVVTAETLDKFNRYYKLGNIAMWLAECKELSESLPDTYLPWTDWEVRIECKLQVTVEGPHDQSPSE